MVGSPPGSQTAIPVPRRTIRDRPTQAANTVLETTVAGKSFRPTVTTARSSLPHPAMARRFPQPLSASVAASSVAPRAARSLRPGRVYMSFPAWALPGVRGEPPPLPAVPEDSYAERRRSRCQRHSNAPVGSGDRVARVPAGTSLSQE